MSETEWIKKIRNVKCDAFFFCCDDLKKLPKTLGQIGEVLRHNDNGYLVKPGDRRELVKAILELAKNDALRKRLGSKTPRGL